MKTLGEFFNQKFLKQAVFYLNLQEGVENPETDIDDALSAISGMSMANYKETKEIKIQEYNKKKFSHGNGDDADPVSIDIKIKNIESLEVKIFEINTVSYCKSNTSEFDINIDLDGLIPAQVQNYDYSSVSSMVTHLETFNFENI